MDVGNQIIEPTTTTGSEGATGTSPPALASTSAPNEVIILPSCLTATGLVSVPYKFM